jgi:hypothetical protein
LPAPNLERSLLQDRHAVGTEDLVGGRELETLDPHLRHEQAVERIVVMLGQGAGELGVARADRQLGESVRRDLLDEVARDGRLLLLEIER